jgi:protein gp37
MASNSKIEWTETTWNPVSGCSKVSDGCLHCYAERMAKRLQAMGNLNYRNGFNVTLHPQLVTAPLAWKKPRVVFVNSMSDLFHEDIPDAFIRQVFVTMRKAHWHTFQVLTKRSERLKALAPKLDWPRNVWMGVSVENCDTQSRIDDLRTASAAVRFLSLEPLLGPLPNLNLGGIHWAIVGGESGPGARPMNPEWVLDIRDQCEAAGVPFFFKQWGGVFKKRNGRELEGKTWSQYPQKTSRIATS